MSIYYNIQKQAVKYTEIFKHQVTFIPNHISTELYNICKELESLLFLGCYAVKLFQNSIGHIIV